MFEHEWHYDVLFPQHELVEAEYLLSDLCDLMSRAMRRPEDGEDDPVVIRSALPIYSQSDDALSRCQPTGSQSQIEIITEGQPCLVCALEGRNCASVKAETNGHRRVVYPWLTEDGRGMKSPGSDYLLAELGLFKSKKRNNWPRRILTEEDVIAIFAKAPKDPESIKGWFPGPRERRDYIQDDRERLLFSALDEIDIPWVVMILPRFPNPSVTVRYVHGPLPKARHYRFALPIPAAEYALGPRWLY